MPNLLRYPPELFEDLAIIHASDRRRVRADVLPWQEVLRHGRDPGRAIGCGAARLGCFTAGSALDVGEVAVVGRRWEPRSAVLFDRSRALDNVAIEKIQHLEPSDASKMGPAFRTQ